MNTEDAVREILKNIGEDPEREGLKETPSRVARAYEELFSGYKTDPSKIIKTFTNGEYDEMIVIRDIEYFSTCEHHMLPFFGVAHVAYIPDRTITGLSKIPRLIDAYAKRLQNQEHLTVDIANTLFESLKPQGVAVYMSGKHLCMCGRGVQKFKSETITTSFLGSFKEDPSLKSDFFSQVSA